VVRASGQGFTRSGTFVVLDGWHGQVFSLEVGTDL
jgi:hypothetical protein